MAAFSIPARHVDLEGPGGIRPGRRLRWWYGTMSSDLRRRHDLPGPHDPKIANEILAASLNEHLTWWLPWGELPEDVLTTEREAVLDYLRAPHEDMWKLNQCAARSTAPNLNVCGWYDHCNGSIDLHTAIVAHGATEKARRESKLVIGPWSHHTLGKRETNGFDFGPEAKVDLDALQRRWFDRYLKGLDTGIEKEAPVRVFVMGANRWRNEQAWPLERARPVRMYLASEGKAAGPLETGTAAGGKLISNAPSEERTDRYDYDPRDPVPSMFGAETYTVPVDQRKIAHRRDVLFYESEPLAKPLEMIGYPECELFAATSAADTDFIVKLVDVAPDGTARDVSTGIVRARYRDGVDQPPRDITPGEVVKYAIRMKPTAVEFQPGHRIRVQVTSSDFPSYDRNHNTGVNQNFDAELKTARQTIHHGGARATCVVLPVISD
jgi:putative CocE/NonD family hydrolase